MPKISTSRNQFKNLDHSISPDITIEFINPKQNNPSNNIGNRINNDMMVDDDDADTFFNPLIYCAITMDDEENDSETYDYHQDLKENSSVTNDSNFKNNTNSISKTLINNSFVLKNIKKTQKNLHSNENSSFVCNGVDSNNANKNKKRFSCHICQKSFGWTTDLKRHILIHTGERPFKCTLCLATFTRNFLLQKHKSKIHQCLSPNEITQLNTNVAKNIMEIKLKMQELEEAKLNDDKSLNAKNVNDKKFQKNSELLIG